MRAEILLRASASPREPKPYPLAPMIGVIISAPRGRDALLTRT